MAEISKIKLADGSIVELKDAKARELINSRAVGQLTNDGGEIFNDYTNNSAGQRAHAEGSDTTASGGSSHAEGNSTTASGEFSHAEGYETTAYGFSSHAEGYDTTAYGGYAHAEGYGSTVSGHSSHAEGFSTRASGDYSHAEGDCTTAYAPAAHAEGMGTYAYGRSQHVQGECNIVDPDYDETDPHQRGKYAHIVGNGSYEDSIRSNAHTLDWNGNAWFQGKVFVGGTGQDDENAKELIVSPLEAYCGQILSVKATDGNNKPIEWEAINFPDFAESVINVYELPDTGYDESRLYRLQRFKFIINRDIKSKWLCYAVEALPESGEPALVGDLSDESSIVITVYANIHDGSVYGYIDSNLSAAFGNPEGWYPIENLMEAVGWNYAGMIADITEDPCDDAYRLLVEAQLYYCMNGYWYPVNPMTFRGTADVGQTLAIKSIDEHGRPTEWEAVDFPESSGDETSPAIIDVIELPTEDIDETVFYRLLRPKLIINQEIRTTWPCYPIESLPESGEPAIIGDLSDSDTVIVTTYYNVTDGGLYGYVNSDLSAVFGVPAGWYPAANLMQAVGWSYGGVITDITTNPTDDVFRLLVETVLNSNKDGKWTSIESIGWRGTGPSAEIFNSPLNVATGLYSHAEGSNTTASSDYSHAEGSNTTASGDSSHAEGADTIAEGSASHAEGADTIASGNFSHAEGYETTASGGYSHTEGYNTTASAYTSHAEGDITIASGNCSHAEGERTKASGRSSHAEGYGAIASGNSSHAEGGSTIASGYRSHAEGSSTIASGEFSHAEGSGYLRTVKLTGDANATTYIVDTSDGIQPIYTYNIGMFLRYNNKTVKIISTTEDPDSAEGIAVTVTVDSTLDAESPITSMSLVQLYGGATGISSHVEGTGCLASGDYSSARGYGTTASGRSQHTQGEYNIDDPNYGVDKPYMRGKYAHIVGNGANDDNRSNAHTLDWDGNAWFQGKVLIGGTGQDDTVAKELATIDYVDSSKAGRPVTGTEFIIDDSTVVAEEGAEIFNDYNSNIATGSYSHAEGSSTTASGYSSHTEGEDTVANNYCSHAEGSGTTASNHCSHAEGDGTTASGESSHAEGTGTTASGYYSHAEGDGTIASGHCSHAEGTGATASGDYSHAEGWSTIASNHYSHAEGDGAIASGHCSHAEGTGTIASGETCHAEGGSTIASGYSSHAEGSNTTASSWCSHAEGDSTIASNYYSHAEGYGILRNVKLTGDANATTYTVDNSDETKAIYTYNVGMFLRYNDKIVKIINATEEANSTEKFAATVTVAETLDAESPIDTSYIELLGGATGFSSHVEGTGCLASGECSHAEGSNTIASGDYSHTEGNTTIAYGDYSHAEGNSTIASGDSSHAEGIKTEATGKASHATGELTKATKWCAHAEGYITEAMAESAHAEGEKTIASGYASHAEGLETTASGGSSHAEGSSTTASGTHSHAEGRATTASEIYAHAEGYKSTASGRSSHAEGEETVASNYCSHAEGYKSEASGETSHTEGEFTKATEWCSHAEGYSTIAGGESSHAEGERTVAKGYASHVEGYGKLYFVKLTGDANATTYTIDNSDDTKAIYTYNVGMFLRYNNKTVRIISATEVPNSTIKLAATVTVDETLDAESPITSISEVELLGGATGFSSHVEGTGCLASGDYSSARGYGTTASGKYATAEGNRSIASGPMSHAEGGSTIASGYCSYAEGDGTEALGYAAHAEGRGTHATNDYTHAEGYMTSSGWGDGKALGAHAEGLYTQATGRAAHSEGEYAVASGSRSSSGGRCTEATGDCQRVWGQSNIIDEGTNNKTPTGKGKYLHVVGNGTAIASNGSVTSTDRSNAHTLDWDGNATYAGAVTSSTGADYAEYFEWADGNPGDEDRVGLIVALDGEKIRLANMGEEILGVVSGTAAVIGDTAEWEWQEKYLKDKFGRTIWEPVEQFIEWYNDETGETEVISVGFMPQRKLNPNYNPEQEYIPRAERKEWDTIGMLGKLHVIDDGSCEVGGYATVGLNGKAMISLTKTNMYVMKRIDETTILVLLK